MADSLVVATRRDGTIKILDGAANSYIVSFQTGDFSFAEPKADRVVIRDRGAIVGLRKGDDAVITGSFSVHLRSLTDTTADNLLDNIYNRGFHTSAPLTTTGTDGFEQYLSNIEFTADTSAIAGKTYKATFSKCLLEMGSMSESADGDSIEISFECYGGVTYAQT